MQTMQRLQNMPPPYRPRVGKRVELLEHMIDQLLPRLDPVMTAYRPYVDGLEHLPSDGRFLLVGNHTPGGNEALLIPYFVRRHIGARVRPLADRQMANMKGFPADMMAAVGAVVGTPDAARALMAADEPVLVFPGGGREMNKANDQLYTLLWHGRTGFARIASEYRYPIIPVALMGGDDVYRILTSSDGRWAQFSKPLTERLTGRSDMTLHLMRGIGPTLIPRPQRMYLRFGAPIDTTRPTDATVDDWAATVRDRVKEALESDLTALQDLRASDPYRRLAPWAWRSAVTPAQHDDRDGDTAT